MALTKNAPQFDAGDDVVDTDTGEVVSSAPTAAERVAAAAARQTEAVAATSTAVTPTKPAAVSVATTKMVNPLADLKDAIPVAYGSLKSLMVTNGNVAIKDGKELLGTYIGLEILSWQDQWVCSPGGDTQDDESKEFLKFSDDGVTERESGEPLAHFVQLAKDAGYEKAGIKQRIILVGAVVYPGKDKKGNLMTEIENEVFSIDLAPLSRGLFLGYQATAAFKVGRGLLTPEQAKVVKLMAVVKSKGSMNWTDADFKTYDPATDYVK